MTTPVKCRGCGLVNPATSSACRRCARPFDVSVSAGPPAMTIEELRRQVEGDPMHPGPHVVLAEALSGAGDRDGAVQEYKTAASLLYRGAALDDSILVLERLLHHAPEREQAKFCAALYLSRGLPQDGMHALAKLQVAFQQNPRDPDTLAMLARAFDAIGQPAKAANVAAELTRVQQALRDSREPPQDLTGVLDPAHFALFGALIPGLKRDALAGIGAQRPPGFLMSAGLKIAYSITVCEGGHYHHVSISYGPATPRAVGTSYLLFFVAALGVPWKAVAFGVSDSSVHHAHFRTISLAEFADEPMRPARLGALLAEAQTAPIEWKHIPLDR